jgi:hypothetical protein
MRYTWSKDEACEPPLWGWCDFCGSRICLGDEYYEDEGLHICTLCARRYAWSAFLERSAKRLARAGGPL